MSNLTPCHTKGQQPHYASWTDSQPGAPVLFHLSNSHRPCDAVKKSIVHSKPFSSKPELSFQWRANAGTQQLTHCHWWVTPIQIPCLWVDYLIRQLTGPISSYSITIISRKWMNWHQHLSQKMKGWMHGWGKKKKKKMIVVFQYMPLGRTLSVQAHNHFLSGYLKQLLVKCIGRSCSCRLPSWSAKNKQGMVTLPLP